MAPNRNRQPAPRGKANPKQAKKAPATKAKSAPAPKAQPKKRKVQEENTPGSVLLRLALLLCTGLIVVGLLFASINGGSQYVGLPEQDTKTTPTPPMATVDPMQNVEGSDMTPIPPSASPEATSEGGETAEQAPTP